MINKNNMNINKKILSALNEANNTETELYTYNSVEEAAYGEKLLDDQFFDSWCDSHDIKDYEQREYIWDAVEKVGWNFFHNELIDYFENCSDHSDEKTYEVTVDEKVIVRFKN